MLLAVTKEGGASRYVPALTSRYSGNYVNASNKVSHVSNFNFYLWHHIGIQWRSLCYTTAKLRLRPFRVNMWNGHNVGILRNSLYNVTLEFRVIVPDVTSFLRKSLYDVLAVEFVLRYRGGILWDSCYDLSTIQSDTTGLSFCRENNSIKRLFSGLFLEETHLVCFLD